MDNPSSSGAARGARGLRSDQVSGLLLIALAAYTAWENRVFPLGTLAEPGPGYVPMLIAVFIGSMGLLIAARGGHSVSVAAIGWTEAPRAVVILVACSVAAFALERIGYRLTMIALLVFFLGAVERRRPLPVALTAAGFSLGTFYLFSTLLRVQLPRSPWGF